MISMNKNKAASIAIATVLIASFITFAIPAQSTSFNPLINLSSNNGQSRFQQIAVDNMNVYAVWQDNTGISSGKNDIFARVSTDGGNTFGPVINVSNSPSSDSTFPHIAAVGSNAFVVWQENIAGNNEIMFNAIISGVAGTPTDLSNDVGNSRSAQVAASGSNVYVVWQDNDPGNSEIFLKIGTVSTSVSFGSTMNISSNPLPDSSPQIAASGSNAYVVWQENNSGNNEVMFNAIISGVAGTPINLSNNVGNSRLPQIAATPTNVYVAWQDNTPGNNDILLSVGTVGISVTFGSTMNISNNAGDSRTPAIAASGSNAYVVWRDNTGLSAGNFDIFLAMSTNSGSTFGAPVNISNNSGDSRTPRVAASGTNAYVVWRDNTALSTGNFDILLRVSVNNGSTFGSTINLSNNAGESRFAQVVTGSGVFEAWRDNTPGSNDVFVGVNINAGAEVIAHGSKFDRVKGTIVDFLKDNVEVKAHLSNAQCSGTFTGSNGLPQSFTGTVSQALATTSPIPRSQQAKFIHMSCDSLGTIPKTGIDGRAVSLLTGTSDYMLTGHDLDDIAIWYKTSINTVTIGQIQSFGFHKFVVIGSYYPYAMNGTVLITSNSTLNLQNPDYVDWIYSPDGIYMYYPFMLNSTSTWAVQICTSVPTGYQIVGSTCQNITTTPGSSNVVLFQVQKLGSPDPDMHVKIKATHKKSGNELNLELDVPGKAKGHEKEKGSQGQGAQKQGTGISGFAPYTNLAPPSKDADMSTTLNNINHAIAMVEKFFEALAQFQIFQTFQIFPIFEMFPAMKEVVT